jgi:hypothetical protein
MRRACLFSLWAACVAAGTSCAASREIGLGAGEAIAIHTVDRLSTWLESREGTGVTPPPIVTPRSSRENSLYVIGAIVGSMLFGNGAVLLDRRRFHKKRCT